MKYLVIIGVLLGCAFCAVNCTNLDDESSSSTAATTSASGAATVERLQEVARNFVEEGRTFVHHAVKRMAFILPAIFFKMGIAFTLLVLVTIVAVNNGFIGFMLLVVGLSTVLARLQDARHAPLAHYAPHYGHYGHFLDRSDTNVPSAASEPASSSKSSSSSSAASSGGNVYKYAYDYSGYPQQYTDVVYNRYGR